MCIFFQYFPPPTECTIFTAHRVSSWKAGMDAFSVLEKHHFLDCLLHSVIIDWLLESIIDLGLHFLSVIVLWVS